MVSMVTPIIADVDAVIYIAPLLCIVRLIVYSRYNYAVAAIQDMHAITHTYACRAGTSNEDCYLLQNCRCHLHQPVYGCR